MPFSPYQRAGAHAGSAGYGEGMKCAPEPRREEMPARPAALRPTPVMAGK